MYILLFTNVNDVIYVVLLLCRKRIRNDLRRTSVLSFTNYNVCRRLVAVLAATLLPLLTLLTMLLLLLVEYTQSLDAAALQHVFRATVVARLTYAASAWRGLTKASDRQRINSVIDRARRHGYCSPDLPTFDELFDAAADELFSKTVRLSHHVLHTLLPPPSTASQNYNLRHRHPLTRTPCTHYTLN